MNVPTVKNEISVGTLVAVLGLFVTLASVGAIGGRLQAEVMALQEKQAAAEADSRALVRLQTDMDYLKRAVDELRGR